MVVRSLSAKLITILGSRRFFYVVLGFFVFQALWFVASAAYPMAFDEEYHFGLIKAFAEEFSPFATSQPESIDSFSAIIRDPSYLYHFALSLPYRFIALFTDNQTTLVIALRLLNVALFAWGLVLFRKVLLRAKATPALAHIALAVFVLIPIVPQLAAHISYDNVLLPMVAWMCLLVANVLDDLRKRKLTLMTLTSLLLLCMAMSLVKYESLPFIAAAILFVVFMAWRAFRGDLWKELAASAKSVPRRTVVVLVGLGLVLFGLMVQRYGVNVWQYQALKPKCHQVLSEQRCEAFGPWARDHRLAQTKGDASANPLAYTWTWLVSLHYRLFFAISGPGSNYQNYPPLPLPAAAAVVLAVSGTTALLLYWRRVFVGHQLLAFLFFMSLFYIGALWLDNYSKFLETGQPVAINGRYLVPVLLPLAAVFGRALGLALRTKPGLKTTVATVAVLLFLHGGGVFTFISRSNENWYWPNAVVRDVNEAAQRALAPVIIEGSKTY